MLRTVGLCVIVISGIGCGFAMSNELGRRKKMMEMILRMIILLRGEIRYGNKSLYDAFTGASGKLEGKYREFFILTAQKMKEKTGDSFGTIFRESAGKCLDLDCLSQEERDRFYSLGDQLGYLGLDMQLKQMDLMEKETEFPLFFPIRSVTSPPEETSAVLGVPYSVGKEMRTCAGVSALTRAPYSSTK